MVNEVYLMRATGTEYKIDISPVNTCEDTYVKSPTIENYETIPGAGTNPVTGFYDTKQTKHLFTLTGAFVLNDGDKDNGVTSLKSSTLNDVTSKHGRARLLYGYNTSTGENTQLTFHYDSQNISGIMTRFTTRKHGGEN